MTLDTPICHLPGRCIAIVGTSGSGKTTLACQLAQRLNIKHIELDALSWDANWINIPTEIFRERVAHALKDDAWIVDGNYSGVRNMVWGRADTVVWLDYSFRIILWRLLRRTLARIVQRQELWNGNRETWRRFFSRDSILLWAIQTYQRRRREYSALMGKSEYAHLNFIRLSSPHATRDWLLEVSAMSLPERSNRDKNSGTNWIVVASVASIEAEIIAGRLKSLGVPVFLQREAAAAAIGLTIGVGAVKILVPESHYKFVMATLYPDESLPWLSDGEEDDEDDEFEGDDEQYID